MGGDDVIDEECREELAALKLDRAKFCENTALRIKTLETWKHEQNSDIAQIRDSLTRFKASSQKWLVGMLTSLLIALILLIANLSVTLGTNQAKMGEVTVTKAEVQSIVEKAITDAISVIAERVERASP